jgi:AraC-like DNA-binding protein
MTTPACQGRFGHPFGMRLVRSLPHLGLRDLVGDYADFEQRADGPVETAEAASAGLVLIVDLGQGWAVEGERFGSFVGGVYLRPVRVRHEGSAQGIQVNLEPTALRRLTGIPAGELRERTVGLEDLFGRSAALLAEELYELRDSAARFAALDRALLKQFEAAPPHPRPDVEWAWRLLRASGGRIPIEELARRLGCSRRHLARRFAEDVGATPKQAARLIRFEAARRRVQAAAGADRLVAAGADRLVSAGADRAPLARIAAECGYADQAHMAREFRELAGAPPTAVPFVQDGAPAAA